jgi:CBS domain-containing protein
MTRAPRLARHTKVADAEHLLEIEPLVVGTRDDLVSVMRQSTRQPATRLIGVVDEWGRLVGVLPILRIAESVIGRVVPEALLAGISDIADVARFGHAMEARTAGEAMLPPATIRPDRTITDAFRTMHQRHLSGLYVIDDDGRPTGYIDLLELALAYADAIDHGEAVIDPATTEATSADPSADSDRA